MLHLVSERYDSHLDGMEYELFGPERIAQMEQEDLDRYHRSILKNSVTMEDGTLSERLNLCLLADEIRSEANDEESMAQADFNDNMLQFRDETKSAMAELKSGLSDIISLLRDLNSELVTTPVLLTPSAGPIEEFPVCNYFDSRSTTAVEDDDMGSESTIKDYVIECDSQLIEIRVSNGIISSETTVEHSIEEENKQNEESDCVVLDKMDDHNNARKVSAEMPEPILEENMVSIEVPNANHYLLDERHMLSPVDSHEHSYALSYKHVFGDSVTNSLSLPALGFNLQIFDPGTLALLKQEGYERQLNENDSQLHCLNSVLFQVASSPRNNAQHMIDKMTPAFRTKAIDGQLVAPYTRGINSINLTIFDPGSGGKGIASRGSGIAFPFTVEAPETFIDGLRGVDGLLMFIFDPGISSLHLTCCAPLNNREMPDSSAVALCMWISKEFLSWNCSALLWICNIARADDIINNCDISPLTHAVWSIQPFANFRVGALAQLRTIFDQAATRLTNGHYMVARSSDVYVTTVALLIQRLPFESHTLLISNNFGYPNAVLQKVMHQNTLLSEGLKPTQARARRSSNNALLVGFNFNNLTLVSSGGDRKYALSYSKSEEVVPPLFGKVHGAGVNGRKGVVSSLRHDQSAVDSGNWYYLIALNHFRIITIDSHDMFSLRNDSMALGDNFTKSSFERVKSKLLRKFLRCWSVSLDESTNELDLVPCFVSWIGLLSPMRANSVWDPVICAISVYILEDNDVFKRVGNRIVGIVMIKRLRDGQIKIRHQAMNEKWCFWVEFLDKFGTYIEIESHQHARFKTKVIYWDNSKLCFVGGGRQFFYCEIATDCVIRKSRGLNSVVSAVKFGEYSTGNDRCVRVWGCKSHSTEPVHISDTFSGSVETIICNGVELTFQIKQGWSTGCLDEAIWNPFPILQMSMKEEGNELHFLIEGFFNPCSRFKQVKAHKVSLTNKDVMLLLWFCMVYCSLKINGDKQDLGFWFGDMVPNACPTSASASSNMYWLENTFKFMKFWKALAFADEVETSLTNGIDMHIEMMDQGQHIDGVLTPNAMTFFTTELEHYIWDPGLRNVKLSNFALVFWLEELQGEFCMASRCSFHHLEDKVFARGG